MVHGWGGSYARTWQEPGWDMLLADAGRTVIGVDLLGHGTAPKPHDPEAYADLTERVVEALPDGPVDAIGFSMGAMTLLELAIRQPERISRLVLAGVGANLFREDPDRHAAIVAAVEGHGEVENNEARLFAQYAAQPENDAEALAAVMKRRGSRLTPERVATVTIPVLVVLGDKDFAGPADPLMDALPNAKLVTLPGVDHFRTTESFGFIDAALEFLEAQPG
jgi:pimeloyl-ACP methyl ester carboxylesterase